MKYNRLFESILDNISSDDAKNNASDRLADNIKSDNDNAFDSSNLPKTTMFTQMLAFMCGLKSKVNPVPGLIKQELDRFTEDVNDIFQQTPEVTDSLVCVLTAYDFYEKIDPRVWLISQETAKGKGANFSPFRLNFCVCWNHPLKNPRTVRLLMLSFDRTLRKSEFLEFDNMCCRIVEDNHWNAKYFLRFQNFDNYISIQAGLTELISKPEDEFWNIYNLQRYLCPSPKLFYNLCRQFGSFDNSEMLWRHMLLSVADLNLIKWFGDDYVERYAVSDESAGSAVNKLIGTRVSPVILNDYDYAVVCLKPAFTSNYSQDMYAQISDAMGNDVSQNIIRENVYAGNAVIRKCMFLRSNNNDNMCFMLMEPLWNQESKAMFYFGIVYIKVRQKKGRTLNHLLSGMFKSFGERPKVTIKALYDELKNSKLEFAYRPARN